MRALSLTLLADLKEAHERLAQDPSNSSRPPSSRAPWETAQEGDEGDAESADSPEAEDGQETPPPGWR